MNYRTISGVTRAFFKWEYYRAVFNIFKFFYEPWETLYSYATFSHTGHSRAVIVRTPVGPRSFTVYCPDDLITAVECFAKLDYKCGEDIRVVVDMGSNIGISAAYFLSRNENVKAYLYEPVINNVHRLRRNLTDDRYTLEVVAVGTTNGIAKFAVEPTGRYGGINQQWPDKITVSMRSATDILDAVLRKEGHIDVLKIDIEGMEVPVLSSLPPHILDRITTIFAETHGNGPELPGFTQRNQGSISVYDRNNHLRSLLSYVHTANCIDPYPARRGSGGSISDG